MEVMQFKREIYSNVDITPETRKISNHTPKRTRNRKKKKAQG